MKLSVVIPVYNEIKTIEEIIRRVQHVELEKEIILVDDCSSDGSREYLQGLSREKDIIVCFHERNQGKGASLQTGFEHVTGDVVVVQDADLEYDPEDYHRLIKPILENKADVVYGSRFLSGSERRILLFWHSVGNHLLTFLSNMITDLNLSDMETCYKMFRREILEQIHLEQKRFGFEPEFTVKIAKIPTIKIYEVGISYHGRDYSEGKKIGWKDAIAALWCLLKYRCSS
ncbi:glycosyl transferase [candidate division KSB3 bacterium]|uniref:Glycosyl transferase n=1 Tax=candidate division KSB3 bacterium TaxID=2044937 RepID=A0A2G6E8I5_9BACT|nr:MAG: glycosyl transferase [candidate division KSB3 bacterium]PIE30430.1 MAG: glycosyl transferase [candidate division KSB3 bacterium]